MFLLFMVLPLVLPLVLPFENTNVSLSKSVFASVKNVFTLSKRYSVIPIPISVGRMSINTILSSPMSSINGRMPTKAVSTIPRVR